MALDPNELGYFIEQVGLAAKTVGISDTEANTITSSMSRNLNYRCLPPVAVIPGGPVGPQSMCTDSTCDLANNAVCSAYDYPGGISPRPALVNGVVETTPSATPSATPMQRKKSNVLPIAIGVAVPVGILLIALTAWLVIRSRRKISDLNARLDRVEGSSTPGFGMSSDKASYMVAQSEATPTLATAALHPPSGTFYDPHTSTYIHHSPDPRPFSGEPFSGSNELHGHTAHASLQSGFGGMNPVRSSSGAVTIRTGQPPHEMA